MLNPINVSICLNIGTTLPDTISILHELKIRKREKKIPFSIYIKFTATTCNSHPVCSVYPFSQMMANDCRDSM